jgi:hypothetical protein
MMGSFGILSARTCPNCPIDKTLWWKFITKGSNVDLSEKEKETLRRIINEPKSILIED